jgi:2-phosphoglycerate kinase
MGKYNYAGNYIKRFQIMNKLYSVKYPLIILISGTNFVGKSTIATKLSEKMNIPNILQTQVIFDVMSLMDKNFCTKQFYLDENYSTNEKLIEAYISESQSIRKGAAFDIQKALSEGKPLIIEGHHIIPSLYINDNYETSNLEQHNIKKNDLIKNFKGAIIFPFLLTLSENTQYNLLKIKGNEIYLNGEPICSSNVNHELFRIMGNV